MEKPHKRLDAWKLSMDLVIDVYQTTDRFPSQEKYGLTDQIRRATISIPSNIAEGAARQTKKNLRITFMAQGSLSELDTQVELARRLGYLDGETWRILDERMERIDKLISGLIHRLKK
ncbi:MAG: four helix bundle protein [Deltaproteobacteria bacterium]|nr:MAG: four helix bundle protein [Deltaproteobacteria bacterium]